MSEDDNHTGFSALPTWRAVYLVVFFSFVAWDVLLTLLTRIYS